MPDIRIHREHRLGLAKARKVAAAWADEVARRFDMHCNVVAGKTSDTVEFKRSGVAGRLVVAADHFDLDAKLGLLLGVFAGTIEAEVRDELDRQLALGAGTAAKKTARSRKG